MKTIKILVDARWFDFYSGVSTYIKGIYNALAENPKFLITVIGNDESLLRKEFCKKIQIIEHKSKSNFKRLYYDIPKIIEKHSFDYAHFQYICPFNKKCKYIVTLHDLLFLDFKKAFPWSFIIKNTFLFYISAKLADRLVTVSNYSKHKINHHFGIDEDKIYITPNGVLKIYNTSHENAKPYCVIPDGNYLLYVSRIEPRKNHLNLVKAYVELALYKDYKLVFIGKTTISVKELNEYIAALPNSIISQIIFIENISESDLHSFYKNATLFAYPSISEGFGIPPIEALSLGTKTICSGSTALKDFDFLKEYQFDPLNIDQIKDKIITTLNDKNYPIERFQQIIDDRYNWTNIARKFADYLQNDVI